jgi:hypothetical protein
MPTRGLRNFSPAHTWSCSPELRGRGGRYGAIRLVSSTAGRFRLVDFRPQLQIVRRSQPDPPDQTRTRSGFSTSKPNRQHEGEFLEGSRSDEAAAECRRPARATVFCEGTDDAAACHLALLTVNIALPAISYEFSLIDRDRQRFHGGSGGRFLAGKFAISHLL